MYRRPKFLEILDKVRQKMSREADYDVDLFAEKIRAGAKAGNSVKQEIFNGLLDKTEGLITKTKK